MLVWVGVGVGVDIVLGLFWISNEKLRMKMAVKFKEIPRK